MAFCPGSIMSTSLPNWSKVYAERSAWVSYSVKYGVSVPRLYPGAVINIGDRRPAPESPVFTVWEILLFVWALAAATAAIVLCKGVL